MTHIDNIPHILNNGITHQKSPKSNSNYVPIGDISLISKREDIVLFNNNKLGDYIPFYFGPRMPMLYVIKLGSGSIKYNMATILSQDIVYCITSVEAAQNSKIDFVFSNGHAVSDFTDFYGIADIDNLLKIVDFNAVNAHYWLDENDLDLKRRKEAEFLIKDDLPVNAILGFAVYNNIAKQRLIQAGIMDKKIVVKPEFYF